MATIKDFKQDIANAVLEQKENKRDNLQYEVYYLGGKLHAMYTAYYCLKHKLNETEQESYINKIINDWKKIYCNGWCGIGMSYTDKASDCFIREVLKLISNYAEEIIYTDKQAS